MMIMVGQLGERGGDTNSQPNNIPTNVYAILECFLTTLQNERQQLCKMLFKTILSIPVQQLQPVFHYLSTKLISLVYLHSSCVPAELSVLVQLQPRQGEMLLLCLSVLVLATQYRGARTATNSSNKDNLDVSALLKNFQVKRVLKYFAAIFPSSFAHPKCKLIPNGEQGKI